MDRQNGGKARQNIIIIGGTGRNAGKTALAVALIKKVRGQGRPVNAAKVVTVERKGALCPRGGAGCGACSLESDFALCEEYEAGTGKDTSQLVAAGAGRVFLLRSLKEALPQAFETMRRQAGEALLIVESNSLRTVIKPALFVMLVDGGTPPKPSARDVMRDADMTIAAPFPEDAPADILARLWQADQEAGVRPDNS
jgi:hypothetical protein